MTQGFECLDLFVFIRKKKNRSGTTSVIVVSKVSGLFKELKTIGVSSDLLEIEKLVISGRRWIEDQTGCIDIFKQATKEDEEKIIVNQLFSNIENVLINGTQLILEKVFNLVGFNVIEDDIFRHLVIARLSQPMSKLATSEYLKSHFDEDIALHKIYRYLDKLHNTQQNLIQQISIAHTTKVLGGNIGLLFYDVTTLYFETENNDEIRESGFSKDGKHSQPQIVLGLLVSKDGYPLTYSIFNGSQYEGRTMIPIVEDFVRRFNLEDFVLVADSGLMNKSNLQLLESGHYKYIIGARIKNEPEKIKSMILNLKKEDNVIQEIKKENSRLVISYSNTRARKDQHNREKGIERLKKAYQSGKITKNNINKKGYNKFLEITNNVLVSINQEKIIDDQKWDGLKGYITNTTLSASEVIEQYNGLWQIEKAFRITKGTLETRPIFHFNPKRIEAHVCLCFVSYKIYKELERILRISKIDLSVDKVLSIAKTITTIKVKLPVSNTTMIKTLILTKKQKSIEPLFDENFYNQFIKFEKEH